MSLDFANTAGSPNIDYIIYSGVPPISGLAACSMVARIAVDSNTTTYGSIFAAINAAVDSGIGIGRHDVNQKLYCFFKNADASISNFPFTCDGTMRSVVISYDGSAGTKVTAIVDGSSQVVALQPTCTTIGSVTGGSSGFAMTGAGYRFNGRICDVGVYNRVITAAEAAQHAAGYSCKTFPRGLIFYAPLIREVHDIAGGLTGTITGTTVADHPRIYA